MPKFLTLGQAAKELGLDNHKITYAIRFAGAPEPAAGKVGNRRIFSPTDIEALREWFAARRDRRAAAHV